MGIFLKQVNLTKLPLFEEKKIWWKTFDIDFFTIQPTLYKVLKVIEKPMRERECWV